MTTAEANRRKRDQRWRDTNPLRAILHRRLNGAVVATRKALNEESDLTIEYLADLAGDNPLCAVTGLKLDFTINSRAGNVLVLAMIDPELGYMRGNVQFLSLIYKTFKDKFTYMDMRDMAEAMLDFD